MKTAENIEKLIKEFFKVKKSSAAISPQMDEKVLNDALTAFEKSKINTSTQLQPSVWRIIMKSSITKVAIAAVLLIATVLTITLLNKSAAPAYAFEQTMTAVDGMRYFHFKQFGKPPDRYLGKEAWVEYGPTGTVKNLRFDVYDKGEISQSVAWKEGKTEFWARGKKNLKFFEDADYTAKILFFASRYNPKGALEYLDSLEKEGKVKIQIEEPTTSQDDILVTAIYEPNAYLLQRQMPAIKDVYHIDNASRLVKAVEIFYLDPNGPPKAIGSWEYCDYNQPLSPELLDLNKEASSDVNRIDMMAMDIGIEQGDLSDSAIAVETAARFLDALVDEDYTLAGKLVGEEMTEQQVRQKYENLHILEVISIGEPKMDEYMSWIVPVKVMIEKDGKTIEREFTLKSGKVLGHPSRRAVEAPELKCFEK